MGKVASAQRGRCTAPRGVSHARWEQLCVGLVRFDHGSCARHGCSRPSRGHFGAPRSDQSPQASGLDTLARMRTLARPSVKWGRGGADHDDGGADVVELADGLEHAHLGSRMRMRICLGCLQGPSRCFFVTPQHDTSLFPGSKTGARMRTVILDPAPRSDLLRFATCVVFYDSAPPPAGTRFSIQARFAACTACTHFAASLCPNSDSRSREL